MAAIGFSTLHVPRVYAVAWPAYGGVVLAALHAGRRALGDEATSEAGPILTVAVTV